MVSVRCMSQCGWCMVSVRSVSECERCIGECEWCISGCDVNEGVRVVFECV